MLHCHRARHPHLRGLGSFLRVQRHRPMRRRLCHSIRCCRRKIHCHFNCIIRFCHAHRLVILWGKSCFLPIGRTELFPFIKFLFAAVVLLGSTVRMELAWSLSDTFNALLAIPNLIAITILSREVFQLTKDYVHRYFLTQKTANSQRIKAAVPGHNRCRRG